MQTSTRQLPPASVSRFAAEEFRRRQALAADAVRAGKASHARANQMLRPWLAIACLAGADLPELEDGLAELRVVEKADHTPHFSEAEVRAMLAHDICRRVDKGDESSPLYPGWQGHLERARDKAFDDACNTETLARARQFLALSRALQVHSPVTPRKTAPQRELAA